MDAEAYGGGGARGGARGRGSTAAGDAYIRISEEEIADDYPMPKQYEKVSICRHMGPSDTVGAGQLPILLVLVVLGVMC